MKLDLNLFQDFPPQQTAHSTPRLCVNGAGVLTMNGAFLRRSGEVREFQGKYSRDGSQFLLIPGGQPNIRFSKTGGVARNRDLAGILERLGFDFPALYTMEWSEEHQVWVGTCREMSPAPAFPWPGKPGRRGGRLA